MVNNEKLPKAYKECIEILKYIPENEYNKIPSYIIENMKIKMDTEYKYILSKFDDFENQEMLDETKVILAVLFRDYWATEEQRKKIKAKENHAIQLSEEEKIKKYNPNTLFKHYEKESGKYDYDKKEKQLIEYRENFFMKLKNMILKILHIN